MSRYFQSQKFNRSIFLEDGLYQVKTEHMHTYHRTFEEACDAYHMVYGQVPVAGPLKKAIEVVKVVAHEIVTQDRTVRLIEESEWYTDLQDQTQEKVVEPVLEAVDEISFLFKKVA